MHSYYTQIIVESVCESVSFLIVLLVYGMY